MHSAEREEFRRTDMTFGLGGAHQPHARIQNMLLAVASTGYGHDVKMRRRPGWTSHTAADQCTHDRDCGTECEHPVWAPCCRNNPIDDTADCPGHVAVGLERRSPSRLGWIFMLSWLGARLQLGSGELRQRA